MNGPYLPVLFIKSTLVATRLGHEEMCLTCLSSTVTFSRLTTKP